MAETRKKRRRRGGRVSRGREQESCSVQSGSVLDPFNERRNKDEGQRSGKRRKTGKILVLSRVLLSLYIPLTDPIEFVCACLQRVL